MPVVHEGQSLVFEVTRHSAQLDSLAAVQACHSGNDGGGLILAGGVCRGLHVFAVWLLSDLASQRFRRGHTLDALAVFGGLACCP